MSTVDYGEYKIGTMSKQSKDERNPEISTISEWIPTYGSWAGPEWAGGVSVPRGDDIDWYEPPCMNKAIKNANANPLECYSLVDAITKTHDWDYEVAEHSGGLEGLKKTQADAKMLTDLAIKTNDLETNGYTTYVCGTGIDPETGAPYDPFFYTATLIDETETSYIGLLVPLFTIKLVADPLAAAKDLIVGACMSVWNYVKGALGTNEVTYSDTVKTTTVEEENGGLIWEKYNGDSRTADAWILNPDNIKSYTTAEVTFGEGGTKPENTYEYLGNGVCRVNGSDIGDRIFASDDTENQAQLVLEGGGGKDKYYIPYNSGDDKIIDSGENEIYYTDENGEYHKAGNYYKDSSDVSWSSLDDETQFNDSSKTILLEDGGTIELSSDFEEGDFDIRLIEIPDNPNTNNTVTGDQDLDNVNDELYGTEANDRIEGLTGDDDISASLGGDDWLLGGVGSDVIVSQNATGKDILEGNAGRDILWGGLGDDKVFGENYGQMETVIADGETAQSINELGDLASGCAGDDFTYGSNRIDLLFGSDGNDLLVGGGGGDVIWGDNQFTYAVRNWGLTIDADGWASTITMVGIDYIEEEVYGDDVIYAGTGNDFVYAGSGNDEIYTGDDNDYAYGEAGDDFIEGGDGNDVLVGDEYTVPIANQGNDYIDGGSGDDMMRGDAGSDDLFGGDGNDTIYGDGEVEDERTGDDYIDGEAGDDGLYGYGGNDVIFGGDGNDNIEGDYLTAGDDYIDGEAGNDTIIGAGGSDQVYGGDGGDQITGGAGNDYIDGKCEPVPGYLLNLVRPCRAVEV